MTFGKKLAPLIGNDGSLSLDSIQNRAVYVLLAIGAYQMLLFLASGCALYEVNMDRWLLSRGGEVASALWVNASLIGFSGSLLYFARKTYVYLITNKVWRIGREATTEGNAVFGESSAEARYRARLLGYYVYLLGRPFGGLAIGPLVAMIILGGLTSLSKAGSLSVSALSEAGAFTVYVFSFIGGYISSDLFDYLSRAGSRLLAKGNEVKGNRDG
jgi:hypothetical protein